MKTNFVAVLTIFIILLVAGVFTYKALNTKTDSADSEADRAFGSSETEAFSPYTDLEGNVIDLAQFAGSVRVVNSWATWSPFSATELKDLSTLASEIDEGNGVVIAINRAEPAAKVKAFLKQMAIDGEVIFVLDPDDRFYKSVDGFSMPETIFYDAKGNAVFHQRGVMTLEAMRESLSKTQAADNN